MTEAEMPPLPGQALFRFVRHWSRRANTELGDSVADRGREVLVAEAVHALETRGDVTVNDIAAEIGIHQSGVSRMVADAVGQDLLIAEPSSADARRRAVRLTPAGETMLQNAHAWQEEIYAKLTDGWTERERLEFGRLMIRLLAASEAQRARVWIGEGGTGPQP